MLKLDDLKAIVAKMEATFANIQSCASLDTIKWFNDIGQFRHEDKNKSVFVFLKGVRYASLLNASLVLLEQGYVQEIGVLCRCMDESGEDVLLFAPNPKLTKSQKDKQIEMLNEFYQEEFIQPTSGMPQNTSRNKIPRKKIRATIAATSANPINSYDYGNVFATIYDAYSGYVHCAYPHIMELYGGTPSHFHTSGMLTDARILTFTKLLETYVYRGLLMCELIAFKLGAVAANEELKDIRSNLEALCPNFKVDPNEALAKLKHKK